MGTAIVSRFEPIRSSGSAERIGSETVQSCCLRPANAQVDLRDPEGEHDRALLTWAAVEPRRAGYPAIPARKPSFNRSIGLSFTLAEEEVDMRFAYGVVWALAGLLLAVVGRAVTPAQEAPRAASTIALGILGGVAGGLVIDSLSRPTVHGFTAGFIGSLMGSSVVLIIWSVVAKPAHRSA